MGVCPTGGGGTNRATENVALDSRGRAVSALQVYMGLERAWTSRRYGAHKERFHSSLCSFSFTVPSFWALALRSCVHVSGTAFAW
jgi:hypothetical protein